MWTALSRYFSSCFYAIQRVKNNIIFYSGTDVLAAGGDRSVQVYDSRNWRLRLNWKSACKYDIVKLLKAPAGPKGQSVYVCGLDNEILLCDISSSTDIKDCEEGDAKRKGQKRKLNDAVVASEVADINSSAGPSHASLPDSSKLRISHHRSLLRLHKNIDRL